MFYMLIICSTKNVEKETAVLKNLLNTQQRSLKRLQRVEGVEQTRDERASDANTRLYPAPPPYTRPRTYIETDEYLTSTLLW